MQPMLLLQLTIPDAEVCLNFPEIATLIFATIPNLY